MVSTQARSRVTAASKEKVLDALGEAAHSSLISPVSPSQTSREQAHAGSFTCDGSPFFRRIVDTLIRFQCFHWLSSDDADKCEYRSASPTGFLS
jgi:hypothetical protein